MSHFPPASRELLDEFNAVVMEVRLAITNRKGSPINPQRVVKDLKTLLETATSLRLLDQSDVVLTPDTLILDLTERYPELRRAFRPLLRDAWAERLGDLQYFTVRDLQVVRQLGPRWIEVIKQVLERTQPMVELAPPDIDRSGWVKITTSSWDVGIPPERLVDLELQHPPLSWGICFYTEVDYTDVELLRKAEVRTFSQLLDLSPADLRRKLLEVQQGRGRFPEEKTPEAVVEDTMQRLKPFLLRINQQLGRRSL